MIKVIEVEECRSKVIPRKNCPDCQGTGIIQKGELKGYACIKCMKFSKWVKKQQKVEVRMTENGGTIRFIR